MRLLLINPTAAEWRVAAGARPRRATRAFRFSMLPSLYVAAATPPDVQTHIVDEDVEPIDFEAPCDLVGISFMTFNAPRAYELARRFRARGRKVIAGGFHPTFRPEEALQHFDAVCVGEAEANVPRMIADHRAGRLGGIYENGLADLRGLPFPDRTLLDPDAYITLNAVQATRGCPHRCKYCSVSAFARHRHRRRPVDEVVAELEQLGRHVFFLDDNLTADPEYAKALFHAMIPLGKRWVSQTSVRFAEDDELVRLAVASGCRAVFLGLESLSQRNLACQHKHINNADEYVEITKRLHRRGVGVMAGLVFGMDHDTPAVFGEAMRFLDRARIDSLQATVLTPFPGTRLHAEMEAEGRIVDHDWGHYDFDHVVFEPRHMEPETLLRGMQAVLRHFYARRRIGWRSMRQLRYLSLETILRYVLPLNLGYRSRFRATGVIG